MQLPVLVVHKIRVKNAKNYAQSPAGYNSVMGVGDDAFREGCNIKRYWW